MNNPDSGDAEKRPVSEPLARNVDALMRHRRQAFADESWTEKLAARMADFTGSVWSVVLHAIVFGGWILTNTGALPLMEPWDPSLVVLAMIASVEAIFLTSFVLMNQRRQARIEDDRAELTLQISLLAEHETTKLAGVALATARQLGVKIAEDSEIEELTHEVSPETILDEIERQRPD
jgi:uncharacterized membrane protein